ncbi:hypothetical protein F7725_014761, partial [Dissostichus mawsoni]
MGPPAARAGRAGTLTGFSFSVVVGVSRVWSEEEEVFSFVASTALDWLFRAPFSKGCVKESRSCFSLTGSLFSYHVY